MSHPLLTGPEKTPLSGEKAKHLVIFLHGLGASGHDLIDLADTLAPVLPHTHFLSPHAPFPYEMGGFGYEWFNLYERTESTMLEGIRRAAPILNFYIDNQLERLGLEDEDLCLVGFSQGTMMGLHVALRREKPCAGMLGYSGMLVAPTLLEGEIRSHPPVMLVHGDDDQVVPPMALQMASNTLTKLGVLVTPHLIPGLGHGIDGHGLQYGAAFLKKALHKGIAL